MALNVVPKPTVLALSPAHGVNDVRCMTKLKRATARSILKRGPASVNKELSASLEVESNKLN